MARPDKQPAGVPAEHNLGVKVFADACASCHRWDGKGNQSAIATLMGLKTVNDPAATNLLGILLTGHGGEQLPVDQRMPRFAEAYSDPELAAVSSFVLQHFGQSGASVSAEDVAAKRGNTGH